MRLKTYLRSLTPTAREQFAKKAKTTVPYLYQIAGDHRDCGPKLAVRIEKASEGKVTKQDLRSDLFGHPVAVTQIEARA